MIVIRPDRVAGLCLIHGGSETVSTDPVPDRGGRVAEPGPVKRLIHSQLNTFSFRVFMTLPLRMSTRDPGGRVGDDAVWRPLR